MLDQGKGHCCRQSRRSKRLEAMRAVKCKRVFMVQEGAHESSSLGRRHAGPLLMFCSVVMSQRCPCLGSVRCFALVLRGVHRQIW